MAASGALSKHGFPRGWRFTPNHIEMTQIVADRLLGRPLPPQVAAVFHDIHILEHHPQQLYEQYKAYREAGHIYFFSERELKTSAAGNVCSPDDSKTRRPSRTAYGGSWKPSGGSTDLYGPDDGALVGKMVTMVFYDKLRVGNDEKNVKTHWGLHEYIVPVGPNKFSTLAAYSLYKVKNAAAKRRNQLRRNGARHHHVPATVADHHAPFTSSALSSSASSTSPQEQERPISIDPIQYVPAAVADHHGPSTSAALSSSASCQASSTSPQEQEQPISIDPIQYYLPGQGQRTWPPLPAATSSQVQQDDTKQLVPAAGAPGYFEFAAAPDQVTTPPAAVNPGEHQAPVTAPADQSGVTASLPTTASPVAEQRTPAMLPPRAQQIAGCDETMDEASSEPQFVLPVLNEEYMSPMLNNAADDGPVDDGIADTFDDFFVFDGGNILFSMAELTGTDSPSSGDENNQVGGKQ